MKKNIRENANVAKLQVQNLTIKANELTIQFLAQATNADMEAIYAMGYNLFINKNYNSALHIFKLLAMVRKNNPKYWNALANTQLSLKQYEKALGSYIWALDLDPNNIKLHLLCIKCALNQKNIILAEILLQSTQKLIEKFNLTQYQTIIDSQIGHMNRVKQIKG